MGQNKKQAQLMKESSQSSQGGPVGSNSKRLDDLETKLDKIMNFMAAMEDRVKKQEECHGARAI